MKNGTTVPKTGNLTAFAFGSDGLPSRKGPRPKTIIGPLHVQCNGHGDPKYLNQLLNDVLSWPHIESTPGSPNYHATVTIRLHEKTAANGSVASRTTTEIAQVLLA